MGIMCGVRIHKRPHGIEAGIGAAESMEKAGARKPRLDKRRATGRIEHTLLVGGWRHLNRPKTFAHNPPRKPTIPQKVTNVSIYYKGPKPSRLKAPTL